jgi:hypothetical protein
MKNINAKGKDPPHLEFSSLLLLIGADEDCATVLRFLELVSLSLFAIGLEAMGIRGFAELSVCGSEL